MSTDREAPVAAAATETAVERYKRLVAERATGPTQWLEPAPALHDDMLWRGLTRGGEARLLLARATATVREATLRLECSPDVACLVGEIAVATALVRQTLHPDERIQMLVTHKGPVGQIIVDGWENGGLRAYVQRPTALRSDYGFLLGEGTLQVTRSHDASGRVWRSTVELQGERVAHDMMRYLLESEQILSLLDVDVQADARGVIAAAGYLVQLMPDGRREHLRALTHNLEGLAPLRDGMSEADPDARAWAEALLRGLPWDQVARTPVTFQCRCSEDRILAMVGALPQGDIEELAASKELLEMTCDYCQTTYRLAPRRLDVLLEPPS
ncbi:MAG: Hsp33 family molecular chaperone HslO [Myxococcales bacterium]|nr:Hsp33 family molecular chaperone HslO [Myxococcales bacterium]